MLNIQNIYKNYGKKTVAHDISFSVSSGEIVALLGASGSGKSTLLHIIAGLVEADSGSVILNQRLLNGLPPESRKIAMMFQDFALLPHLNVLDNIIFGLKMRGINKAFAIEQADDWLVKLGLENLKQRRVQTLSGGEQQRVALARALVVSPQLLLLDEPFSGIDTALRAQLQNLVKQMVQQQNIPTILVTHDPIEANLIAQKIALLIDGQLVQIGNPNTLLQRPVSATAARLMGCLNVNEQFYIPPQSIVFKKEEGINCPIIQLFRLPNQHRIDFMHPQFGLLTAYANHTDLANKVANEIPVYIDRNSVVYF